ncbi:acyl carrier protein [Streptomyces sp. TRM72054]|uniref:acyl carrier protein n=1 Tax=Streptomyces TaxID=1883 RepID=UPI0014883027|nr:MULTISPECIES: acyl carrier protein [Streptomyces]MBX9397645.1 acyl carrier protein [Streptomyces sp. TRM72054]
MTTHSADTLDQELFGAVAGLLVEIAEIPAEDITPEARFRDDLDVDSLLMVEFGVSIEDRFGVAIPDDEFTQLHTVGELVAFVQRHKSA